MKKMGKQGECQSLWNSDEILVYVQEHSCPSQTCARGDALLPVSPLWIILIMGQQKAPSVHKGVGLTKVLPAVLNHRESQGIQAWEKQVFLLALWRRWCCSSRVIRDPLSFLAFGLWVSFHIEVPTSSVQIMFITMTLLLLLFLKNESKQDACS